MAMVTLVIARDTVDLHFAIAGRFDRRERSAGDSAFMEGSEGSDRRTARHLHRSHARRSQQPQPTVGKTGRK